MKKDNEYRAASDARKRARGLYKPSIWVHNSWRGTEAYEKLKERLGKERVVYDPLQE